MAQNGQPRWVSEGVNGLKVDLRTCELPAGMQYVASIATGRFTIFTRPKARLGVVDQAAKAFAETGANTGIKRYGKRLTYV